HSVCIVNSKHLSAGMAAFNAHDPKYYSCCCGAHITRLSRVLIVLTLLFYSLQLFSMAHHAIAGLLITFLGAIAVFRELRTLLLVYIMMMIINFIISVTHGLIFASWTRKRDSEFKEFEVFIVPMLMALYFIVSFFVLVSILMTYRNLAEFIKDREDAERLSKLYQANLEKQLLSP
ncbi:hypothetical protein PMAYCL1PPCAC_22948, partial [Pristionchus mayeri]